MKLFKFTQLVILISLFTAFTSCEKDDDNDTPKSVEEQLAGLWNGDEFYEDDVLDPWNDLFKASTIEFKANGSGTTVSLFGAQPFTWSYDESTEKLRIETEAIDDGNGVTVEAHLIEAAEIIKIDASNLWYTYEEDGAVIEIHYKK